MEKLRTYDTAVAANIIAARARRKLSQKAVAARMHALGFGWRQQIVAAAENGRRVTAGELLGLAWALETSIDALMRPSNDDKVVAFPNGETIGVLAVQHSVDGQNDGAVTWEGNTPVIPRRLGLTHSEPVEKAH